MLSEKLFRSSILQTVLQLSMLFHAATDGLSTTQVNFLKALIDGVEHFRAKQNLEKYQPGASANIQRIKKALAEKEIIDTTRGSAQIIDPIYAWWLKHFYWK